MLPLSLQLILNVPTDQVNCVIYTRTDHILYLLLAYIYLWFRSVSHNLVLNTCRRPHIPDLEPCHLLIAYSHSQLTCNSNYFPNLSSR